MPQQDQTSSYITRPQGPSYKQQPQGDPSVLVNPTLKKTDVTTVGAEVITIAVGLVTLLGIVVTWFSRRVKKIAEKEASEKVDALKVALVKDLKGYKKETSEILKEIKEETTELIESLKRNSREHLHNELQRLQEAIKVDEEHQTELIGQKLKSLNKEFQGVKEDILLHREQAMSGQLQMSDVMARVDMLVKQVDSKRD